MPTGAYTAADLAPTPQQTGAYSQADLAPQQPGLWQRFKGAIGSAQDAFDKAAQTQPVDTSSIGGFARSVGNDLGAGAVRVFTPLAHPVQAAVGMAKMGSAAMGNFGDDLEIAQGIVKPFIQNPSGEAVAAIPQAALALAGMGEAKAPMQAIEDSGGGGGVFRTPPVEGQNYTPTQLRARAAATAYGNASAGTVPQDLAAKTGSILRDTAAHEPEAVAAINGKNPLSAVQADIDLHQAAQARIDQAHETILAPVRNRPVDTSAIQQAVHPSPEQLQGMDPADVNVVNRMQARAANVTTLGGLNKFRQFMNTEDTTLRGNPSYAQTIGTPALVHDMANATREAYYNALQDVTGQDFTGLKRMEGALIKQSAGLQSALPRLSMAEARANAPFDLRNATGDILEGTTRSGAPGLPIISGAATKIGEAVKGTKLAQMQRQLQTFYSDLPAQSTVQMPQGARIAGLLQRGPIEMQPPAGPQWTPSPSPPVYAGSAASRLGRMLPAPPIELPGAVEQSVPAYATDTTAARTGRLLPAQSGAPSILPYNPQMTIGEQQAAMMQYLRRRQQLGLPAKSQPIPLPSSFEQLMSLRNGTQ